ncbi:MAG TPA: peptidoglycan bridge formation glycyltransferase FemA/FemB family protein [Terriglobia bacterium]|nr:peptidoglycan bridge formation glycyltransferase FemA/FemB family protein [Terriglobia bacterium]
MHGLDPGYASEVDAVDEHEWYQILQKFNDANIYQTYAAGVVYCGRRNISHLILKKNGEVVAAAQAKILKLPWVNVGTATIQSGPLLRIGSNEPDLETFRRAVRALRNEYVCKRGLVLRILPDFYSDDPACFSAILAEEGFSLIPRDVRCRTILMDLRPSLEEIYGGIAKSWRRNLKRANARALEVIEGTSEGLFKEFLGIYEETVSRKKFVSFADINKFRQVQARLPENLKMIILLARSEEGLCAGLVCTAIGNSATPLFAATSNAGMASRGSYLLHWSLIKKLKERGFSTYDLGGIDPTGNPGTYRFKNELGGRNGRDVYTLGCFDAHSGGLSYACVNLADGLKTIGRNFKELVGGFTLRARGPKVSRNSARFHPVREQDAHPSRSRV